MHGHGLFVALLSLAPATRAPDHADRRAVSLASRRAACAGLLAAPCLLAAPLTSAAEPLLTASQALTSAQYVSTLKEVRSGLDKLDELIALDEDRGYEASRIALRKEPVKNLRKAASKMIALLPEGDAKRAQAAAYEKIKANLEALDSGCRPEAGHEAVPEKLGALKGDLDELLLLYSRVSLATD